MRNRYKDAVAAILKYQKAKNSHTIQEYGTQLIPQKVRFTEDNMTEDMVEKIQERFRSWTRLGTSNCLHCLVYTCEECPYSEVSVMCDDGGSLWKTITKDPAYGDKLVLEEMGQVLRRELDATRLKQEGETKCNQKPSW